LFFSKSTYFLSLGIGIIFTNVDPVHRYHRLDSNPCHISGHWSHSGPLENCLLRSLRIL
jgi:hypothetical protein